MLYRKISTILEDQFLTHPDKITIVEGPPKVGKTTLIQEVGQRLFKNIIVLDMAADRSFQNVSSPNDFYLQLSAVAGDNLHTKEDTLIFLDNIQIYPEIIRLLKLLQEENRYTYVCAASYLPDDLLTEDISQGIQRLCMHPLNFEEFLFANGLNQFALDSLKKSFLAREPLSEPLHKKMLDLFKKYLLVGGFPSAVDCFVKEKNIWRIREIHKEIYKEYLEAADFYKTSSSEKARCIYEILPSCLNKKKKRIFIKNIEGKVGKTYSDYKREFDFLSDSGLVIPVICLAEPRIPLLLSQKKSLLKLYLNDVGLLSSLFYDKDIRSVIDDKRSVQLGALYENAVAVELASHGHSLFYYDDRYKGEADFLLDDEESSSFLPIQVRSGKDYSEYSALSYLCKGEAAAKQGIILSNDRLVREKGNICYLPVYFCMFL